jgi:hypothetical protein
MPHLYGCNVILGTNDIHAIEGVIDGFEQFKVKAEDNGFEVPQLLWLPDSHTVFILFDATDRVSGDPDEVLASLLLTELPNGVSSFTTTQAYTTPELQNVVNPPSGYSGGTQQGP